MFRQHFFAGSDVGTPEPFSREFDAFISQLVTTSTGASRTSALADFERHPLARLAHPTIEHFLPLLVVAGAAGEGAATKRFEGFQHSLSTSVFEFAIGA